MAMNVLDLVNLQNSPTHERRLKGQGYSHQPHGTRINWSRADQSITIEVGKGA